MTSSMCPRPHLTRVVTPVLLGLAVVALLAGSAIAATPAGADAKTVASPKATVAPPLAPLPGQAEPVKVTGFRSALFGMSESDVRAAIGKDFSVSGDAIKPSDNLSEQTHVLTVQVPDVLPNGGAADVAYVFGYKTKKLIQVSVVWSKAIDPTTTPERLFSNGNILRAHFASAGYKSDTVITDAAIKDGLLMFRGADADGHTTVLLLQGSMAQGDNNRRVLTPASLLLIYLSDAKNPDVFRLAPGQF